MLVNDECDTAYEPDIGISTPSNLHELIVLIIGCSVGSKNGIEISKYQKYVAST